MAHDTAAATANNPSASAAERTDALAELQRNHIPSVSELLSQDAIAEFAAEIQGQFDDIAFEQELAKSMNTTPVPFPSRNLADRRPGMHSVTVDELQVTVAGDYIERPGMLQFDSMRLMVAQTPVLAAVVNTRVRQVQRFCRIAESGELPGFEVRHVDREHQLTEWERAQKQALQSFVANCGWEANPLKRKALKRDSFKGFMSKSVRDSLTMDSAPIELEWKRDRALGLDGFYAVDGATIRLCNETGYQGDDSIFALQVVNGRICTPYSYMDLVYEPRNPTTDIKSFGYGVSEVELLIKTVTGFLNAMTYNMRGFDENSIPKGMLQIIGNYTAADLAAFKRQWRAMCLGASKRWHLPILTAKDGAGKAEFTKMDDGFDEMHFSKWMTFLTSIICAVFGMSPAEINFDSFSGGNSSPLSGNDTGERLAASKDSGLYPLLTHFGDSMSDFIVQQFGPQWCFRWTGLEPDDADKRYERKTQVSTVDEARAELGMVAHPDPLMGGAPLSQALVGLYTQKHQAEMAPAPDLGQSGGASGAGGASAADDPAAHNPAAGADFGDRSSGPKAGDFGDEGDQGYGHAKQGDFGAPGGSGGPAKGGADFGDAGAGQDFGKAMTRIYEVSL